MRGKARSTGALGLFLRSFLIQGAWNYRTLTGTGFGWALRPLLRGPAAIRRQLGRYNSHPYLAPLALGAVARMEREERPAEEVVRFKEAMGSTLGSLGDGFFWNGWRPALLLMGMALALLGVSPWIVVAVFLATYNILHLATRMLGVRMGLAMGARIGEGIRALDIPSQAERIRTAGVLFVGIISGIAGVGGGEAAGLPGALVCAGAAAAVVGWVMGEASRRWIPAILLLLVVCGFLPIFGEPNG